LPFCSDFQDGKVIAGLFRDKQV